MRNTSARPMHGPRALVGSNASCGSTRRTQCNRSMRKSERGSKESLATEAASLYRPHAAPLITGRSWPWSRSWSSPLRNRVHLHATCSTIGGALLGFPRLLSLSRPHPALSRSCVFKSVGRWYFSSRSRNASSASCWKLRRRSCRNRLIVVHVSSSNWTRLPIKGLAAQWHYLQWH